MAQEVKKKRCRLYDDNVALYGKRYYYYIWELPLFCLIGIVAGLAGALFVRLYVVCTRLRAKFIPASNPIRRLAEVPTLLFLLSGSSQTVHHSHPSTLRVKSTAFHSARPRASMAALLSCFAGNAAVDGLIL